MRKVPRIIARLVVPSFLVYAFFAGLAEPGRAEHLGKSESSESSILEPSSGALLGQYYGAGRIALAAKKLGRAFPIHLTYYAWGADWTDAVH